MDSVRETHYDFSAPISAVEGSSAKLAGHTQPVGTEQADTAGSRPPLPQQIHSLADKGSLPTSRRGAAQAQGDNNKGLGPGGNRCSTRRPAKLLSERRRGAKALGVGFHPPACGEPPSWTFW